MSLKDSNISLLSRAEELYRITDGTWDGTVNPLVKSSSFNLLNSRKQGIAN